MQTQLVQILLENVTQVEPCVYIEIFCSKISKRIFWKMDIIFFKNFFPFIFSFKYKSLYRFLLIL